MTTRNSASAATTSFGLLATTRYVPRLRLERSEVFAQHRWMAPGLRGLAKGRRAMASWDEDAVTMAVEAGRQLMQGAPDVTIGELTLGSTTLPFAERLLTHGIYASAIRPPTVPDGTSRIRFTVTSEHTTDQIDEALHALSLAGRETGLI